MNLSYIDNEHAQIYVESQTNSIEGVWLPLKYIDMVNGRFSDAILLGQIMYWHLPDKKGNTKMTVQQDGSYWIAKNHGEWIEETRLKNSTVRNALNRLKKLGLIHYRVSGYGGNKTPLIRIHWENFINSLKLGRSKRQNLADNPPKSGQPNTETTTETTNKEHILLTSENEVSTGADFSANEKPSGDGDDVCGECMKRYDIASSYYCDNCEEVTAPPSESDLADGDGRCVVCQQPYERYTGYVNPLANVTMCKSCGDWTQALWRDDTGTAITQKDCSHYQDCLDSGSSGRCDRCFVGFVDGDASLMANAPAQPLTPGNSLDDGGLVHYVACSNCEHSYHPENIRTSPRTGQILCPGCYEYFDKDIAENEAMQEVRSEATTPPAKIPPAEFDDTFLGTRDDPILVDKSLLGDEVPPTKPLQKFKVSAKVADICHVKASRSFDHDPANDLIDEPTLPKKKRKAKPKCTECNKARKIVRDGKCWQCNGYPNRAEMIDEIYAGLGWQQTKTMYNAANQKIMTTLAQWGATLDNLSVYVGWMKAHYKIKQWELTFKSFGKEGMWQKFQQTNRLMGSPLGNIGNAEVTESDLPNGDNVTTIGVDFD